MSPRLLLALAPLPWLLACGDKDTGGVVPEGDDADGDGYPAEVDCDDADAAVHPGADELCNDRDDDCDEEIDEDPLDGATWWIDGDGDGSGNPLWPLAACQQPVGSADNADDCDDASAVSYPGADELCDGLDNDCDEDVDESPTDAPTWYVDEDGDGYGDPSVPIQACEAPSVYVTNGDDCDDTNAALNPATVWYGDVDGDGYGGATYTATGCEAPEGHVGNAADCADLDAAIHPGAVEVCDGADNNCDGDTDGADADGAVSFYEDADLDGWGTEASTAVACEAPEGYTDALGDCDDTLDTTNPDALERCGDLVDNNCDELVDQYCQLSLADADVTWDGEAANDYAGYRLSAGGDYDGDGSPDLAVGAYGADVSATSAGRSYVALGPVTAGDSFSLADAALTVDGAAENDYAGYDVRLGADATGDTYGDVIIGAWGADPESASGAGAAYLFAGPTAGAYTTSQADATFYGTASLDYLGQYEVLVGHDVDHDGQGDVIVGSSGEDSPYSSGGLIAAFLGPVSGEYNSDDAPVRIVATGTAHYVGFSADVGDLDGDGLDDLAYGVSGDTAAIGLYGPLAGTLDADDADVRVDSSATSSFGSDVLIGDFDGDGTPDLGIGAKYDGDGGSNAGAWFLYLGPLDGTWDEDDAVAKIIEVNDGRYLGAQYLSASSGDVDGDGVDDLLAGSSTNGFGGSSAGAAFVFLGPIAGTMTVEEADMGLLGPSASAAVGYGTDLVDLDGDGRDDAVLGARGISTSAGRIYGVLGAGL